MKKKLLATAALALLSLTGCVVYPYRPVAYAYPVDPNMPPPVVYVPSYDPCYGYPYSGSAFVFYFGGYGCNGGGNSVKNTYNYYGGHGQPPQGGGWHGGGNGGNGGNHGNGVHR